MRTAALFLAVALMGIGLFVPRHWAHFDMSAYPGSDALREPITIEVGVLNYYVSDPSYGTRTEPLAELNGEGRGFAMQGVAALVFGMVAAIGSAVAALTRRRIGPRLRAGLVATQVASLIATLVFASRLASFSSLSLGWAPVLCILSVVLGAGAMLVVRARPAR
jgi:hypothetical protein